MELAYEKEGERRVVQGVLLVHVHNHPHVLVMQRGEKYFFLPGGKLNPGEADSDGLIRKLNRKLAVVHEEPPRWEVVGLIGQFVRSRSGGRLYPYQLPHIMKPRELVKVFAVELPEQCTFAVPSNCKLVAVPLFDLYENDRFGTILSHTPTMLSRLQIIILGGSQSNSQPPFDDAVPDDDEKH